MRDKMSEVSKKYIPWAEAGGPNECKHGYAAGIYCPGCDAASKLAPLTEDAPKLFCFYCKAEVVQDGNARWRHIDTDALKILVGDGLPHDGSPFPSASPVGELEGAFEEIVKTEKYSPTNNGWGARCNSCGGYTLNSYQVTHDSACPVGIEEKVIASASSKCPICGVDTPHHHLSEELTHAALSSNPAPAEHENAFQYASEYVGVTWKQAASVACALTHKGFGFLIPKPAPEGIPERPKKRHPMNDIYQPAWDYGVYHCNEADERFYALEYIISAKDAEIERLSKIIEIESRVSNVRAGKFLKEKVRSDAAEAEMMYSRASSAKVREEALREAAAVDIGLPIGAVDPVYEAGFGSGWRNAEYWFRKGIEKLLPTSPESQEAASGK